MPTMPSIFDFTVPATITPSGDGMATVSIDAMPVDCTAMRLPLLFPPYPATFLAPLGAIIVQWGAFENEHDQILDALLETNNSTKEKKNGFTRKKELFKSEAHTAFAGCDTLIKYVSEILCEAASLYMKRNILAHGQLSSHISVTSKGDGNLTLDGIKVSIHGTGFHKGKPVEQKFTMADLQTLFYQIAHLGGRTLELAAHEPNIPGLPLREKFALREFQRKGRLNAPDCPRSKPL